MTEHKHLKHLARVWVKDPVFFITTCTYQRLPILANAKIVSILVEEWTVALERHGWAIGCYVVMPDHVHFFCAPSSIVGGMVHPAQNHDGIAHPTNGVNDPVYRIKTLSAFMQQWKQWTSKRIIRECRPDGSSGLLESPSGLPRFKSPVWQAEFFDHLLRSQESYHQKWEYVKQNPVRAGLVKNPEDWLWQGEIHGL